MSDMAPRKDGEGDNKKMATVMKLLGGGQKRQPQAQSVTMPDPEDPEVLARKRKRMLEAQTRGGRQSTILSGESPMYSGTSLGT